MPAPSPAHEERLLIPPPSRHARTRGVLLFPDTYHLGMSSLATHALYQMLNDGEAACERAFVESPYSFEPIRSLETGSRLRDFDFVAIPSSYELSWPATAAALQASGLSPARAQRTSGPLVIMGGPAITAAPLPMSEVYDAAFIGELEPAIADLRHALLEPSREGTLEQLAAIPGFYVPALQEAPTPRSLRRRCAPDLDAFETASAVLTPETEFADRFLVEIGRGCGRSCSFCLARQAYRPLRWRSVEAIVETVRRGLTYTPDIGLVAAAASDHPQLHALCQGLTDLSPDLQVSTSSLRLESATEEFLALLARGGQKTVTFAPEAATERLRRHIGKALTQADLWAAVERAVSAGLTRLRLYFMVGLPSETSEDRQEIVELAQRLSAAFPALRFALNVSVFSPRPHTPFEHEAVAEPRVAQGWVSAIRQGLQRVRRVEVGTGSARAAALQAILSRGGLDVGQALSDLAVAQVASPGYGVVLRALRARGLDPERYLAPQEGTEDQPWKVVDLHCAD